MRVDEKEMSFIQGPEPWKMEGDYCPQSSIFRKLGTQKAFIGRYKGKWDLYHPGYVSPFFFYCGQNITMNHDLLELVPIVL